jgi:hypothetical protein
MIRSLMYTLATGRARWANRKSTWSAVLRSSIAGCRGLTACQASIACPSSGSTGLVKAVPVLWVGTSSRQTASRASTSPESPGIGIPSCCQRMHPTRSRAISSLRCPANSQVSVMARISSTG